MATPKTYASAMNKPGKLPAKKTTMSPLAATAKTPPKSLSKVPLGKAVMSKPMATKLANAAKNIGMSALGKTKMPTKSKK